MSDLRVAVLGVGIMGAEQIAAGIPGCRVIVDPLAPSPIPTSTPSCFG